MIISKIVHVENGSSQHINLGSPNPFEIPNIYINKLDNDGYYILYSDVKLSIGKITSTINTLNNNNKIKKIKWK